MFDGYYIGSVRLTANPIQLEVTRRPSPGNGHSTEAALDPPLQEHINATVSQRAAAAADNQFARVRQFVAVVFVVVRLGAVFPRRVADGRRRAGSRPASRHQTAAAAAVRGRRPPAAAAAERLGLLQPLLLLHAAVLEPDLDLRLVEAERGGDLDAAGARQVAVEVELLLQFGQLLVGEVRPAAVGGRHSRRHQLVVRLTRVDAVVQHRRRYCTHAIMYTTFISGK